MHPVVLLTALAVIVVFVVLVANRLVSINVARRNKL